MHTPGPWTYIENIDACIKFGTHEGWEVGSESERTGVAFVPGSLENVTLIAAAPDLLAALQEVRAKLHAYNRPNLAQRVRLECRDICDAAIARALITD